MTHGVLLTTCRGGWQQQQQQQQAVRIDVHAKAQLCALQRSTHSLTAAAPAALLTQAAAADW
jgi:hypothetical protein